MALIDEIVDMHEAAARSGRHHLGREVRAAGEMLKRRGIPARVLNAKFHEKEAPIVAQAGRTGAVTSPQHGRPRHDILLGGNPRTGLGDAPPEGPQPGRVDKATYDAALADAKRVCDEDHERVVAAVDCTSSAQSATTRAGSTTSFAAAPVARAIRLVALLPVARRRSDEALRLR